MNFPPNRWVQLGALIALLTGIGIHSMRVKYRATDYDTWWHLKVGDWIVQNSALPHTGILSRTAADRPWVAYSWATKFCFRERMHGSGCWASEFFGTLLTVAVAFSTYWMLRRELSSECCQLFCGEIPLLARCITTLIGAGS
jgi:hypothetical protein